MCLVCVWQTCVVGVLRAYMLLSRVRRLDDGFTFGCSCPACKSAEMDLGFVPFFLYTWPGLFIGVDRIVTPTRVYFTRAPYTGTCA